MAYLASPYTASTAAVVNKRYYLTMKAVYLLLKQGYTSVYSPIIHYHQVAKEFNLPTDEQFWRQVNIASLDLHKQLWVLTLHGWDNSVGVEYEMDYAKMRGYPIRYLNLSEDTDKITWRLDPPS